MVAANKYSSKDSNNNSRLAPTTMGGATFNQHTIVPKSLQTYQPLFTCMNNILI